MRLKSIIFTTILAVLLISAPNAFAFVLDQSNQSVSHTSGGLTADIELQPIGSGFSGTLTQLNLISNINNALAGVIFYICDAGSGSLGCSSTITTLTIPATSFTITSIGSGFYLWSLSSSTSLVFDPLKYYTIQTPVYSNSGTKGSSSSFFYKDCVTSSGGVCGSVKSWYLQLDTSTSNNSSRIVSVTPPDIASSTSASPLPYTFSLDTYLNSDDFSAGSTTITYSLVNRDQGNILTGNFTATSSGNTTYSGSVNTGIPNGFYQGTWSMQLPYTCGNGLDGGCYSPLFSTSTSFVLGYSAIRTINQDYLNATTTEKDCSQFTSATDPNYYICPLVTSFLAGMRWLFIPDTASIQSVFGLFDILKAKAPLGYFFILKDSIGGLATSTPVITYTSPTEIKNAIFTPIRTALTWLLWLFFAFNFYKILKITRII
jgi:hypothetical protein